MQTTEGRLSMSCKYTTLQLCRAVGEESILQKNFLFSKHVPCTDEEQKKTLYQNPPESELLDMPEFHLADTPLV